MRIRAFRPFTRRSRRSAPLFPWESELKGSIVDIEGIGIAGVNGICNYSVHIIFIEEGPVRIPARNDEHRLVSGFKGIRRRLEIDRVIVILSRLHILLVLRIVLAFISSAVVFQIGMAEGDELGGSIALYKLLHLSPWQPAARFDNADRFFRKDIVQPFLGKICLEARFLIDRVHEHRRDHHAVCLHISCRHPDMYFGNAIHRIVIRKLKGIGCLRALRQGKIIIIPKEHSPEIVSGLVISGRIRGDRGGIDMGHIIRIDRLIIFKRIIRKVTPGIISLKRPVHVALDAHRRHVLYAIVNIVQIV